MKYLILLFLINCVGSDDSSDTSINQGSVRKWKSKEVARVLDCELRVACYSISSGTSCVNLREDQYRKVCK